MSEEKTTDGWESFGEISRETFAGQLGQLSFRDAGEGIVQIRMNPTTLMLNPGGSIHGGAIMTFIDMAIFAGGKISGRMPGHYVTLDCATHFIARTMADRPLDAFVRMVGQTKGGMVFLSGHCDQDGVTTHSFTGTLKRIRDQT